MTNNKDKIYGKEADIFKALSHPTRILILYSIKEEELTVTELAEKATIDISTMSKHLDLLKRHGIIMGKKTKNTVYYKINIPCVFNFLSCATAITANAAKCDKEQCFDTNSSIKNN